MPKIVETFLTIQKTFGPEEFKEKGSRFIGRLYPVKSKEAAEEIVAALRKQYYDSTHVCFAYRLGNGVESYSRYSDDGEPSGTGGLPIYNEIRSKEYFNVLCAVIRYYGGTKLGTGGLARAYGQGGKLALDVSVPLTIHVKQQVRVSFPFDFTGEMMQVVGRFGLDILVQDYSAVGSQLLLDVPIAKVDEVGKQVIERSGGKIFIEKVEKKDGDKK
ncbi:MAG: YigZ family protein [bacterium]|nr:YigZ family protein [bacterium]